MPPSSGLSFRPSFQRQTSNNFQHLNPNSLFLSGRQPAIVRIPDVLARVLARGYRQADIDACLTEYEELNVWHVSDSRDEVRFEQ